jgi:hypothetical protein
MAYKNSNEILRELPENVTGTDLAAAHLTNQLLFFISPSSFSSIHYSRLDYSFKIEIE